MEDINNDSGAIRSDTTPDVGTPDMFNLITAGPEKAGFFYSSDSKPQDPACIGYLRGYYGDGGKRLYTSWFERHYELKTLEFRKEFDRLINGLRDRRVLNTRSELEEFCIRQPGARIAGAWYMDTYGFRSESEKYSYYFRLSLMPGDYAIYCYCYDLQLLRERGQQEPTRKKSAPER